MAREDESNRDFEVGDSSESLRESTQKDSLISNSLRKMSENKFISIALIAVLAFGFYKIVAPKISLLNPITCSSLKKELASKDVVGRQIWNAYQEEVSNLSRVEAFSSAYFSQVGNAARRALQLNLNDTEGYLLMKTRPHCIKDMAKLDERMSSTNTAVSYLQGIGTINGRKFSIENGWNVDYYQAYFGFSVYIK
jgi:hypothetical protein